MAGDGALIAIAGEDDQLLRILINIVNDANRLDPGLNNARAHYLGAIERLGLPGESFYNFIRRCQNGLRLMVMLKAIIMGLVLPEDVRAWISGEKGIDVGGLLARIRQDSPEFGASENGEDY
jgi:hypothetical protein